MPKMMQIEVVTTIRETEIFEIPEELFQAQHNGDYGSLKRELEQITRERNADLVKDWDADNVVTYSVQVFLHEGGADNA